MVVLVATRKSVRALASTKRIVSAMVFACCHTVQMRSGAPLASEAVLDIMSNGRVECRNRALDNRIRVGRLRYRSEDSRPMWEEAIALLPKMWTQEVFEGARGQISEDASARSYSETHSEAASAVVGCRDATSTWEVAGRKGIGRARLRNFRTRHPGRIGRHL